MPPDDSASNEYINNLQNEIDHLKLSLASANASTGIDVENIVKENTDLRIQLEESRKKLEMVQVATNATPSTTTITTNDDDPSWPHDRDEFIKQWTIQANEWNSMRELLEKDKNSFYEIGRAWEIESLKFQALADEREQELKKCKKEIIELSEKVLLVSQPSSSSVISHEEYQKKVKQLEMDMAQKWMSLLMRRRSPFYFVVHLISCDNSSPLKIKGHYSQHWYTIATYWIKCTTYNVITFCIYNKLLPY